MAENQMTIAELWTLVETDNRDTRLSIQKSLDEVRTRLDSFLTKDQFTAEKALLTLRLERAERELEELDRKHAALAEQVRQEREEERARRVEELRAEQERARARREALRSNLWFKVVMPAMLVILPLLTAWWSPLSHH